MVRVLAGLFVLVVASFEGHALPGGFNPDFNGGSPVLTQFSPSDSSSTTAIAIQPDGRIIMGGTSYINTIVSGQNGATGVGLVEVYKVGK